jgi:DNA polymerase
MFDSQHLGPWSRWQGDLKADVVIVGQDWGDQAYFLKKQGIDSDNEQTCTNLREMAQSAGWDIGKPHTPIPQRLFFTNAVLGIRQTDGKSGPITAAWVDDSLPFLFGLLEIVQPKAIVSLGSVAYRACRLALHGRDRDLPFPPSAPLTKVRQLNPIQCSGKPDWFAFYHCGPLGLANRSRELQLQDWEQLGAWLRLGE